ncbi:Double zinc ribbon [Solimonas aquatica]|uniref:Double zinc ribbon n=1 Tax=Solimonas aquatica TaxID=489703 RepID=A0A1H9IIZ8_9GAMM|nr:adenylate/guanylate cyclase domain-containing protein [Solimonas aquatica]SEQ74536.1 Double zinc ribbon [Solimonas aquatica]
MNACPQCQADNPAQARFCNQCGSRLQAEGAGAASPHAYTPRHLIERVLQSRAAMQGERKRVTVLFADIKGSTRLAQQAGAEAWHGILDRYFGLLSAAVHRFEGTVNQYTGDGIMALFGAPLALEDHAQRACLAALEAQREVRAFADALRLQTGLNLSMRIGLNTGEVIVGRIGDDLRMDYTAQGLTVNLAARMEQICEPGRIYATRHTATLVSGYCRLRDLGAMNVAGSDAPVQVYEVEAADPRRTRLERSLSRGASPFVGRENELRQLMAALAQARQGRGAVLSLVGEAGIGKSRLSHEFAIACEREGFIVHRASGVPYGQALPLLPVQHLLRSRLKLSDDLAAAELRRLVAGSFLLEDPDSAPILPQILDLLGVGESRGPDPGGAERDVVLAYLADYMARGGRPQLLLVEDLHFADPQTLDFLAQLARAVRTQPTLLLLNHRPEYDAAALAAQPLPLSALAPQALQHLAEAWLGSHESLDALRPELLRRAGGNPYFVEEAVQALADGGQLQGVRGAYRLSQPFETWPIADSVHALLTARIDRLPALLKTALHCAAVIGQRFSLGLLAALSAQRADTCLQQLRELEQRGMAAQLDETQECWQFVHPLIQELAYGAQLEVQRRELHARLAQLLEARCPLDQPPDESAVRIAHHYGCAGDLARAGLWHVQAARWLGAADSPAAVRHLREALRCLESAPQTADLRAAALRARSALLRMAQFVPMPAEGIDRLHAEAQALAAQDAAGRAELDMSYATVLMLRGQAGAAARWCARSLDEARQIGAVELVDRFRLIYLLSFITTGELCEGLTRIDAAGGSSWREREIGAGNFISRGLRGLLLGVLGQLDEGVADMRAALAVAQRHDMAASWMHANLVDYAWYSGEYQDALLHGRAAVTRSERFGSAFFRAVSLRALGLAYCLNGRHPEALPLLLQAQPLVARGALAHQFEANFLAVLAEAYRGCGQHEQGLHTAQAAVLSALASGSRLWEVRAWIALLAQPLLDAGQARSGLLRLAQLIDELGAEGLRPWLHLAQARWHETASEAEGQRQLARQAFQRVGARAHAQALAAGAVPGGMG